MAENTSVGLEKKCTVIYRKLTDVGTLKMSLVRSQMKMKSMLLETGSYVILVLKWQRTR